MNEKQKDVSAEYFETQSLDVKLNADVESAIPHYAYLSVYNFQDWFPIQWGKINRNHATFQGMGKDVVYLPTYYIKGKNIPAGNPFWLKPDGSIRNLIPTGRKGQVVIRSYAGQVPFNENREHLMSLKGSELWGMKNGKKGKLLYTITDTLQIEHQLFTITAKSSYRFVRLYLPSSGIALGELSFYSADNRIIGVRIISPLKDNTLGEKPEMLIDKLSDTAFCGEVDHKYIDFDLSHEYLLSAIGLTPYIRSWLGQSTDYELSYWENGWQSVGTQKGSGGYLVFDNVPQNVLLKFALLGQNTHEHHRVFLYEDGKIIWL